jgi:hypothetical protein
MLGRSPMNMGVKRTTNIGKILWNQNASASEKSIWGTQVKSRYLQSHISKVIKLTADHSGRDV